MTLITIKTLVVVLLWKWNGRNAFAQKSVHKVGSNISTHCVANESGGRIALDFISLVYVDLIFKTWVREGYGLVANVLSGSLSGMCLRYSTLSIWHTYTHLRAIINWAKAPWGVRGKPLKANEYVCELCLLVHSNAINVVCGAWARREKMCRALFSSREWRMELVWRMTFTLGYSVGCLFPLCFYCDVIIRYCWGGANKVDDGSGVWAKLNLTMYVLLIHFKLCMF